MKINVNQIDSAGLTLAVQVASSGAAFSGNLVSYLAASGWIGPLAVTVTGNQNITGVKTFQISPIVPYSGSTGSAPSQLFVTDLVASFSGATVGSFINRGVSNDLISGNKFFTGAVQIGVPTATGHAVNQGYLTGVSGVLSAVKVSGSLIRNADFTGIGGTLVFSSGNQIFISGAGAGGGGSSNTLVTGSSAIAAPNFTGRGGVTLTYDGTYVNVSGVDTSGYFENNFVHRGLFNDQISGLKTFTGALGVGTPSLSGHAIPLAYLTGVSGVLRAAMGTPGNTYIFSGITGNFVNLSFYFDEYNLFTGLHTVESFVGRDFFFTGYAIGCINSGTQGFFSGSFYQRDPFNIKTNFINFSLNSGQFFTGVGGFNQTISGMNRVGLDIYRIGTGITGLSVGAFGVGY